MVRALSVLIWQVTAVHVSDHLTFARWIRSHGFIDLTRSIDEGVHVDRSSRYARFRLLNFVSIFVEFRAAYTGLDQRLTHVAAYGFAVGSPPELAARQFAEELKALDADLKREGHCALDLDEIVQSVCF